MSATLNSDRFSQYFNNCPTIDIPGRTYPVEKYGLETILDLIKYKPSPEYFLHGGGNGMKLNNKNGYDINVNNYSNKNTIGEIELKQIHLEIDKALKKCSPNARNAIEKINERKINYDLIVEIIKYICKSEEKGAEARQQERGCENIDSVNGDGKAILIFLPGVAEINQCYNALNDHLIKRNNNYLSLKVLQLHGSLRVAEQRLVFKNFPKYRKVVLSTNIAETSITIDDSKKKNESIYL